MSDSIKLKDLYIGLTDGASEAQNEKFEELFYDPNNKYDELMNNSDKFLVLGSKGAGKTYLANYVLCKSPASQTAEMIDGNDYKIHKLSNIGSGDIEEDLVYALCKWFLLDELAHLLIKRHKYLSTYCIWSKVYKLNRFVEKYENEDFFRQMRKVTNTSKEKSISNESGGILTGSNGELNNRSSGNVQIANAITIEAERKEFFELIKSYEKLFFNALSDVDDLLLIVDDLDEIESNEEKNGTVIIQLLNIVKDYNQRLKRDKKKVKIILLLRSDILDKLQIINANLSKIKTSCSVELYWLFDSMNEQYEHPLMSMVLHKIKAANSKYSNWSNKKLFSELFPETIDNKRPLDFLLDYGFGRPRDIVTYLNHAKKAFPNAPFFSASILKETRKLYSSDFYDEMLNQASYHKDAEYIRQCLNLLSAVKRVSFFYNHIEMIYTENKERYDEITNLDDAIKFLYEIGAIGNVWRSNKKVHTCWSYKKDAMSNVDLSKKFTIHYGLRKKFSM